MVCSSSFESASRVVCEDKFSTNARRSFIRCAKELLEATLKVLSFKSGLSIYLSYFSTGLRMLVQNYAKLLHNNIHVHVYIFCFFFCFQLLLLFDEVEIKRIFDAIQSSKQQLFSLSTVSDIDVLVTEFRVRTQILKR